MPGWRVHRYVDIECFGKSYWKIHRKMDEPVVYLGRSHRVLFHDPWAAVAIARQCYPGDPRAVEAANLHILTDEFCTRDPNYKKLLEELEALNRSKRKGPKEKKPKKKEDPSLKKFESDMKKLEELQRLFRAFYSSRR
jgi:hypothetical protein